MNRIVLSFIASLALFGATSAFADAPFNPDCHLEGINRHIDEVIEQIQSSPAMGHAGGHYGRAMEELRKMKENLHEGCRVWNASLRR